MKPTTLTFTIRLVLAAGVVAVTLGYMHAINGTSEDLFFAVLLSLGGSAVAAAVVLNATRAWWENEN